MHQSQTPIVRSFAVVATAALASTSPARADVVVAEYFHEFNFHYEISHMPDLDQVRIGPESLGGLPGFGFYHCVPTSLNNLFAYAANHGFPELSPGPGDWQSQSRYIDASDSIDLFGQIADIDPTSGTNWEEARNALNFWLLLHGGRLVAETQRYTDSYAPKIQTLAAKGAAGAIVAFCWGRYDVDDMGSGWVEIGGRDGGHCVTLAHAQADSEAEMYLGMRDPNSDEDNGVLQSPFATNWRDPVGLLVKDGSDSRKMTSLGFTGDGQIRLIDTVFSIRPRTSFSWSSSSVPAAIHQQSAFTLDPLFDDDVLHTIALPSGATIQHLAPLFGQSAAAVVKLVGGGLELYEIPIGHAIPCIMDTLPANSQVATGPGGLVYVLGSGKLRLYDFALTPPLVAERVDAAFYTDIAYDDEADRVILYSSTLRLITRHKPDLSDDDYFIMPTTVPTASSGEVVVGPDSAYWMHPAGVNTLYEAKLVAGAPPMIETLGHSSLIGFTDFDVDDLNRVFVCVGGLLREYSFNESTGRWGPAPDSPSGLNGTTCSGRIMMSRSRSNFDESMTGPAWRNLSPDELPYDPMTLDCPGDLDADAFVGVSDLLIVLGAWGPCTCQSDMDNSGAVDIGDLLTLLANWGPCEAP